MASNPAQSEPNSSTPPASQSNAIFWAIGVIFGITCLAVIVCYGLAAWAVTKLPAMLTPTATIVRPKAMSTPTIQNLPAFPRLEEEEAPIQPIVFTGRASPEGDIYLINPDGSGLTRLTDHPADDYSPTWSPDHSQIAFVSKRDGNLELYIMDADGQNLHRLTDNPGEDIMPAWSPQGDQIAYISQRDGAWEICFYEFATQKEKFSLPGWYPQSLTWNPSGNLLYIEATLDDNTDLYWYDLTADKSKRVIFARRYDGQPAWAPDGEWVAFISDRTGRSQLFLRNHITQKMEQITDKPLSAYQPTWSPDQRYIAFASNWEGVSKIYLLRLEDKQLFSLTDFPSEMPNWYPR